MLIRGRLHAAFWIIMAAMAGLISTSMWMQSRTLEVRGLNEWLSEVVSVVFDCNILASEFLLQNSERAKEQWERQNADFGRLLAAAPRKFRGDPALDRLEKLRANSEEIFRKIEQSQRWKHPANSMSFEDREVLAVLSSQMLLQARTMLMEAQALADIGDHAMNIAIDRSGAALILGMLLLLALIGLVFYASYRSIVQPLSVLQQATERVARGQFDWQVDVRTKDELGAVANSFNQMSHELQLRQTEVDGRIRDLESFCYSIAHDLKAPLRAVSGFGDLLDDEFSSALGSTGASYIETMRKATLRMNQLIDDLLAYGQLTHKKIPTEEVPIRPLIDGILDTFGHEISRRGIGVSVSGDFPPVRGSSVVIKQALSNLISNAIKYIPNGRPGQIVITGKHIGPTARFEVTDNGIGIAREHQGKIWGLFQRLHAESEFPGTGVGLAMVAKGMERLGGTVGVKSNAGSGSAFWIELPVARPSMKSSRQPEPPSPAETEPW